MLNRPADSSFRHRCALALTHPVTLIAIAVLLVNDFVLKSVWPTSWATGKLSDLAWVVFASPLLAFLLSLLFVRTRTSSRFVLFTAYISLPLLYLAFNTFEPVHDMILSMLSSLAGRPSGGPLDPTDSVVIPLGVAVAAYVWRRTRSSGRLRTHIPYLVAGVAVIASIASTPPEPTAGIDRVGVTEDGILVAHDMTSRDGGLTWDTRDEMKAEYTDILWSDQLAETPRGTYHVEGPDVVLRDGNMRRVIYSGAFFRSESNRRVQSAATRGLEQRILSSGPTSIVYDERSGNVVASMGIQGVLVVKPDGRWTRVAVGPFSPTDFSLIGRCVSLFTDIEIQLAALALGAATAVTALAVSNRTHLSARRIAVLAASTVISVALVFLVSTIGFAVGFMFWTGVFSSGVFSYGGILALATIAILVIANRNTLKRREARLLICAALFCAIGAPAVDAITEDLFEFSLPASIYIGTGYAIATVALAANHRISGRRRIAMWSVVGGCWLAFVIATFTLERNLDQSVGLPLLVLAVLVVISNFGGVTDQFRTGASVVAATPSLVAAFAAMLLISDYSEGFEFLAGVSMLIGPIALVFACVVLGLCLPSLRDLVLTGGAVAGQYLLANFIILIGIPIVGLPTSQVVTAIAVLLTGLILTWKLRDRHVVEASPD